MTLMKQDWSNVRPETLKISLSPLDDFGMPMNRYAHEAALPGDPEDFAEFAKNAGKLVEATTLFVLTGKHPEEPNTSN